MGQYNNHDAIRLRGEHFLRRRRTGFVVGHEEGRDAQPRNGRVVVQMSVQVERQISSVLGCRVVNDVNEQRNR